MLFLYEGTVRLGIFLSCFVLFSVPAAKSQPVMPASEIRALYNSGQYAAALTNATAAIQNAPSWNPAKPPLHRLRIDAAWAIGSRDTAIVAARTLRQKTPDDLQNLVRLHGMLRDTGASEEAAELLADIDQRGRALDPKEASGSELTALGTAALALGADPKAILSTCFMPARKKAPGHLPAHLAAAELALEKRDFALAANVLREARKIIGDDPAILHGLARAWFPSEREKALGFVDTILASNKNHVASLLLRLEDAYDKDDWKNAEAFLERALAVNAKHPPSHTWKSVLALARFDHKTAEAARKRALELAPGDARIDHLIGRKISQKRRFTEGLKHQKLALELQPNDLNARAEMGQDLLRLGREDEAWEIIREVHERDKYNVVAYNLMILHDHLKHFETLETEHFIIRMTPHEAAIYGEQVKGLLEQARRSLCKRYGYEFDEEANGKIVIEFFPDQQDFAIRTLGMPGGMGLLGACFGRVITMNSPGSLGAGESNWASTLWHEFCHAVTLGATDNRMPRWLTEGFSVYEEGLRDETCRRRLTPKYRRLIQERGLIPLDQLSGALTDFETPDTIAYAYFQSGWLVEFLMERLDEKQLHQVLDEILKGQTIELALETPLAPVDEWWPAFEGMVSNRVAAFHSDVDWTQPEEGSPLFTDPAAVAEFAKDNPTNIWALTYVAAHAIGKAESEADWQEALEYAEELKHLYPQNPEALRFLVRIHNERGDAAAEKEALVNLLESDADDPDASLRLLELASEQEDWPAVLRAGNRQLDINPLLRVPHRTLGRAYEAAGQPEQAVAAYQRLLRLRPANPANVHFRLSGLVPDQAEQERHLLQALEEAPRFRKAYQRLLEREDAQGTGNAARPDNP